MRTGNNTPTNERCDRGFALIAVLVALGILMALLTPVLASMIHGSKVAGHEVRD